nr:NosD domain-containing protein [uncultured Bacillus sp.]
MMRWGVLIAGILLCYVTAVPGNAFAAGTLQEQIDAVPSGGTILLKDQVYEESIVVSKPLTIEGTGGAKISACANEPVITISGNDVTVKNLQIESCSAADDSTAIAVSGERHHLENLIITTNEFGIKLDSANHSTMTNIKLTGRGKENGIDLWESSDNIISHSNIRYVQDGIYLENSHRNRITDNDVRNSRYGFHLMFSDQTVVSNNLSQNNSTGTMIMGTKNTLVENNRLLDNNVNVHSQGILLYDSANARIIKNQISTNRVGIFVDLADGNFIEENLCTENFVGMQFNNSHDNMVQNNSFIGNVNDSQAVGSQDNNIQKNYWDLSLKLDQAGDGISMIPYASDPYFLTLSNYIPEYQIFFHSPGMMVLQKLMKNQEETLLRDERPRMSPFEEPDNVESSHTMLWILSFAMILSGLLFFLLGRRRVLK